MFLFNECSHNPSLPNDEVHERLEFAYACAHEAWPEAIQAYTYSPNTPLNGLHPRNPWNYMHYCLFTDPGDGKLGWPNISLIYDVAMTFQHFRTSEVKKREKCHTWE